MQLVVVPRQDLHFQSQGVHEVSSVLNLQVLKQVGTADSQMGQEEVVPRGAQTVEMLGDWVAPQNMEDCMRISLMTPRKLRPITSVVRLAGPLRSSLKKLGTVVLTASTLSTKILIVD
jgi:hypothetical protein